MRREGWERLLSEYLENKRPFKWGQTDCALWSADWIHQATGQDYAGEWRGNYATEDEAQAFMESKGLPSPADIAGHYLKEIAVKAAQRGDLVLHPMGPLGICNGYLSHFIAMTGDITIKTLLCTRAWKVD